MELPIKTEIKEEIKPKVETKSEVDEEILLGLGVLQTLKCEVKSEVVDEDLQKGCVEMTGASPSTIVTK